MMCYDLSHLSSEKKYILSNPHTSPYIHIGITLNSKCSLWSFGSYVTGC